MKTMTWGDLNYEALPELKDLTSPPDWALVKSNEPTYDHLGGADWMIRQETDAERIQHKRNCAGIEETRAGNRTLEQFYRDEADYTDDDSAQQKEVETYLDD